MLASIHNLHYYVNLMREVREGSMPARSRPSRRSSAENRRRGVCVRECGAGLTRVRPKRASGAEDRPPRHAQTHHAAASELPPLRHRRAHHRRRPERLGAGARWPMRPSAASCSTRRTPPRSPTRARRPRHRADAPRRGGDAPARPVGSACPPPRWRRCAPPRSTTGAIPSRCTSTRRARAKTSSAGWSPTT